MKKNKNCTTYDIESYPSGQLELLYKLAKELKIKQLNRRRKLKLEKINNL